MQKDGFFVPPRPWSPDEVSWLKAGKMTLWVYGGEIRFRDAFKAKRIVRIRFMTGGPVGVRDDRLAICEDGNEEN